MSRCTECDDNPTGTRCTVATCPSRLKIRPIALADGEGWPFQMLGLERGRRPADFDKWRARIHDDLRAAFHGETYGK